MSDQAPNPGEIWKHYKGGTYQVLNLVTHTETQEILVVYKSLQYGSIWARPLGIWNTRVQGSLPEPVRRFTKVTYEDLG